MEAVPGGIDAARGPPMTVPLRHFVVGIALLGGALLAGIGLTVDAVPGPGGLVHVHLFLVGWVCVTIMGAMTQFVPVWSGTTLQSRRLANARLALVAWVATAAPAWLRSPTAPDHVLGGPGSAPALLLGVVGFVILWTLYHIVSFVVWVHRYSDRVGLEAVPTVDDLCDDRLAAADGSLLFLGTALLVGAALAAGTSGATLAGGSTATALAGLSLVTLGVAVFAVNALLVIRRHAPGSLARVALGRFAPSRSSGDGDDDTADEVTPAE